MKVNNIISSQLWHVIPIFKPKPRSGNGSLRPFGMWRHKISQFESIINCTLYLYKEYTRWRVLLRYCATSRNVAGSIPDGATGSFHWYFSYSRTMAMVLTHPLRWMSTRNISWGIKAAGAWGWQPYHLHVPTVLKSGSLNLLEPSGLVQACNTFTFPFISLLYMFRAFVCPSSGENCCI